MTKTINSIDADAENAVIEFLSTTFNEIAYLEPDTVLQNIKLATTDRLPVADRSIRVELANYLMSNFAMIFIGLIINPDFRTTFMEAVSVEISLDEKDADTVAALRKQMLIGKRPISKGSFVLDFTTYNDTLYRKFNERLSKSFDAAEKYDEAVSEIAQDLTDEDKLSIGFTISNFMYLIRAFEHNDVFAHYVQSVIKAVHEALAV
jgi:hypothetical protein